MSFSANAIETLVFVVMLAYSARSGFPFSTYGETALIAGQDVVISGLVLFFGGQGLGVVGAWVVGVGSLAAGLMSEGVVGMDGLRRLQVGAGVVGLVGKMPQIWQIWREGGTGVLSAFAVSEGEISLLWPLDIVARGEKEAYQARGGGESYIIKSIKLTKPFLLCI